MWKSKRHQRKNYLKKFSTSNCIFHNICCYDRYYYHDFSLSLWDFILWWIFPKSSTCVDCKHISTQPPFVRWNDFWEMYFFCSVLCVPYGYDDEYWAQRALSIPLWHHITLHMAVFCFWYISNLFLNLTVRFTYTFVRLPVSLLVEHFALTFLLLKWEN